MGHSHISIVRQCELLGLSRSGYYYQPSGKSELNLRLMRLIDEEHTAHPLFGYRKMLFMLRQSGYAVNKKRIARLMQVMGLQAMVPGPNTSRPCPENPTYPYLLRGVKIAHVNQVWSCGITYIPMPKEFVYLFAVIDWYSRFVLAWQLFNTTDTAFCLDGLEQAHASGKLSIFNSDQGVQFTSRELTSRLLADDITISMDGRGRALDSIFVERLCPSPPDSGVDARQTVKYEDVYLKGYQTPKEVQSGLRHYFRFY